MEKIEFLGAPECYYEKRRVKVVDKYLKLKHWDRQELFRPILLKIRKMFGISGVSISLITGAKTIVKYETRLGFREIPREILMDPHCILSENGLVLLDTAVDWRTRRNPLVTGPPHIRFYSGAHLVDENGVVIGALAIFDSYPKMSVSEQHIKDLQLVAKEVMEILAMPYEVIATRHTTNSSQGNNTIDAEIRALSVKLGRATSRGNGITVFEKDGSGDPYSQNQKLRVTMKGEYCPAISGGCLSENERKEVVAKIANLASLKLAAEAMCKSIAIAHKADFVCILEVRMADLYTISKEYLPGDTKKIDMETFKHANKLMKCRKSSQMGEYFQARMLGICGSEYQLVDFDDLLLKKAFLHEIGLHYTNLHHNTKYNKGVLMSIHKNSPKLLRRSRKPAEDSTNVKVYLRQGGYMLGVFNQSSVKSEFMLSEVSRMFDRVSHFHKLYLV